jgi:hypothetical protein
VDLSCPVQLRSESNDSRLSFPLVLPAVAMTRCRRLEQCHRSAPPQSRHSNRELVPRGRRERFAVAADDGFKVAAELIVERRVRAALLCQAKRLRQQPDIGRGGRSTATASAFRLITTSAPARTRARRDGKSFVASASDTRPISRRASRRGGEDVYLTSRCVEAHAS